MPKSNALVQFESSLGSAEALVNQEASLSLPLSTTDDVLARGLRGGAAVLMVAAFQQFLRDLFSERLGPLAVSPPPRTFADLPVRIQVTSAFESLEQAMKGPPFQKPVSAKAERLPAVRTAAGRLAAGLIDPDAFADTTSNPDAAQVGEMFTAVAYVDLWQKIDADFVGGWPTPIAKRFVPQKLDEVVDRRHRVAHTANALTVSSGQLTEGVAFLRLLAQVLDAHLENHVAAVIAGTVP